MYKYRPSKAILYDHHRRSLEATLCIPGKIEVDEPPLGDGFIPALDEIVLAEKWYR